jgi:hypothetical protein
VEPAGPAPTTIVSKVSTRVNGTAPHPEADARTPFRCLPSYVATNGPCQARAPFSETSWIQ